MPHPLYEAATLYKHIREQLMTHYPELVEDEQMLLDTLEGETDIHEILARTVRSIVEDQCLKEALDIRVTQMRDRRERLDRRIHGKRQIVANIMAEVGLKKLLQDDFTVSQSFTRPSVVVMEQDKLPAKFLRVKTITEPDKTAIKLAIESGQSVPGATLSNPQPMLTIRTS